MAGQLELLTLLRQDQILGGDQPRITPLTGGVSSEIYLVEDGLDRFVVKRALPKLKVQADWFADPSRNRSEHAYLRRVAEIVPDAVPQVRYTNPDAGYFVMEYFGEGYVNWKRSLLDGAADPAHASRAGSILGQIHRLTAGNESLLREFDTTANFSQLRLDPYLVYTGKRHPRVSDWFLAEAERLASTRECLVHGDFSPKNILIRGERMVVLDCEVAWYGDPVFDVAFLLNHLFLKALYHAPEGSAFLEMIRSFCSSYEAARNVAASAWESRVTNLLPLLLLARVDGKSPVDYLDARREDFVRDFVLRHLLGSFGNLSQLTRNWFEQLTQLPKNALKL